MKKIVNILILVIIIFLLTICVGIIKNKSQNTINQIEKIIENKEDIIIYIYNTNVNECNICQDGEKVVDEFAEKYNLNILKINYKNIDTNERKKIQETLILDNSTNERNNIIFIKDGEIIGNSLGEITTKSFAEDLYNNGYLSEESYTEEIESVDNKIFEIEKKTLVLIGPIGEEFEELKTLITKIAKKNKISYRCLESNLVDNANMNHQLKDVIGTDNYKLPMVLIIENKQIINYTNDVSQSDIQELIDNT